MTLLMAVSAAAAAVVAASGVASGAPGASMPTLHIALTGKTGVSVSENTVPSGAVNVVTTFSGKGRGDFGIIRLNDGVTPQQAIHAVQSHHGDINALTPYGALIVASPAPGKLQTVLKPSDNYYAINTSGHQPVVRAVQGTQELLAGRAAEGRRNPEGDRVQLPRLQQAAPRDDRARAKQGLPGAHDRPSGPATSRRRRSSPTGCTPASRARRFART